MTDEEIVTSDTGGSKARKLARFDMIPTDSLWELAEHYGKGAEKYEESNGRDNWRNGYNWSLSFAAAFRHMTQALSGEDIDPGTGSKHVISAAWHMFGLAHWMNNPAMKRFDDRQDPRDPQQDDGRPWPVVETPELNGQPGIIGDFSSFYDRIGAAPCSETRKPLGKEDE